MQRTVLRPKKVVRALSYLLLRASHTFPQAYVGSGMVSGCCPLPPCLLADILEKKYSEWYCPLARHPFHQFASLFVMVLSLW